MKILASDFDGTLLVDKVIDKRDIEGIRKLRKEGNKFIVSTGRTLLGLEDVINNYGLEFDYLVLCNGALILDKDYNVIKNTMISYDIVKTIIDEFSEEEETMIYFDNGNGMNILENKNAKSKNFEFFDELDIDLKSKEDILKLKSGALILSVFAADASVERAEKIKERLIEMFGDEVGIFRNQFFVDVVSKGSSKGNGLTEILKLEDKDFNDIYTVGDSFNDISMFDITENSYTFNRAEEGVKEYAKNHIDYVHEIVADIIG